ncbi:DoxX family protein [Caulobacter sp. BK020]|uniref:DoxX family protein n=1 Tax=Caulobacter sp. BK020 TaxID=2512117 RepID=UPI0010D4FDC1|nr:DoxX family protein [Caulobacter sp. BK020]TCS11916.1 putative membrane protein YphA (DoxX/SURF4 family) [Caulobacter sp. BK020]
MIRSTQPPRFVTAVLDWRPTAHVARLALVSAYLLGAAVKVGDFPGAVAEQAHFGMKPPALWALLTIAVEIVGPLLILTRRWLWLGAGMLGVFTLLAAITANAFWTLPAGHDRFMATNAFFEHIGLIGGFVLVARLDRQERTA